ncbi:hypothetical protein GCM10010387_60200 [Streptomyces inusitatus]|uniref:Uncharacterized protein n=1 Tax=Streptomyces inusitatus TaxID=68221 RepID=A0A918QN35_9ACTN|nr:hypothetical protein GCM10010387_60200 [Streptomyces inusitatus]
MPIPLGGVEVAVAVPARGRARAAGIRVRAERRRRVRNMVSFPMSWDRAAARWTIAGVRPIAEATVALGHSCDYRA